MEVINIPFVKKVGIQKAQNGKLELKVSNDIYNHLETIHASAQFTLAETSTGELLQSLFPELVDKVIPVLRDSSMKFKKPACKDIVAYPTVSESSRVKFNEQFAKKGRALIAVTVEVRDSDDIVTSTGIYHWFIQKM